MKGFISVFSFVCAFLVFSFVSFAAQRPAFSAEQAEAKSRFSIYAGAFLPSGSYQESGYPEFEYEIGGSFGLEYDYFFTKNFGIGAYLEGNSFKSEEKTISGTSLDLTVSSTIFGVAGIGKLEFADNCWFWGGLKLGVSSNTLEAEMSGSSLKAETDGSSLAYSVEGGIRYLFSKWDIGFIVKYTGITQEVEGGEDSELGGTSFLLTFGYNF
jgi:hypothetical protein